MTPHNFDLKAAHALFSDALTRNYTGTRSTIASVVMLARNGGYVDPIPVQGSQQPAGKFRFDLKGARPNFIAGGMAARNFVGPAVDGGARLYPAKAISAFVALGGAGKTTTIAAHGCYVTAGKNWNGYPTKQAKVVIFCVEETKEELDRKVSALIVNWPESERKSVLDNLLLVSCLDIDPRMTQIEKGQYSGTGMAETMIELIQEFGASLVFIDHLQGFVSGDLNVSETATAVAREANKIVSTTGAAVVLTAHISKANINAQSVEQGFAVGSLAFENAVRQMVGVIPMPDADAKTYGLELTQSEYIRLAIPKNSYGPRDVGMWLHKVYSPDYHTVVVEPVMLTPPVSMPRKSANEAICDKVVEYLKRHPMTTSNQLDNSTGADGPFKASKEKVRIARNALLDSGRIVLRDVTPDERKNHALGKQVKQVFEVCE